MAYPPQQNSWTDSNVRARHDADEDGPHHDSDSDELPNLPPMMAPRLTRRMLFLRSLALLCACSLSIGSHYGNNVLGPLKSRMQREMGTNNTEFSLLVSALTLNSTWTPLLGGFLASRLGTTFTSILATGAILLGQAFLLIGNMMSSVRLMAFGLFVFGMGVSPLAVVQETIIVRFFKSHGLGVSMAFGLIAGKASSFVAARTSHPLSENYGPHAPFFVASALAAFSFGVNLLYVGVSKWVVRETGAELEASELHAEAEQRKGQNISEAKALEEVARKKRVLFRDMTKFGDVFWAYMAINVISGCIWTPFHQLSANIIEQRYELTESAASNEASYLLVGSPILYPIIGLIVDRLGHRGIVARLFTVSSIMTLCAYLWLALPPTITRTPIPAIGVFAIGQGFAPLLLVVIVPQLVGTKYISSTLGAHKSLEQTGSTIFQTLAGLSLDVKKSSSSSDIPPDNAAAIQHLLNIFALLNVLQVLGILGLRHIDRRRRKAQDMRDRHSNIKIVHGDQYQPIGNSDSDTATLIFSAEQEDPTSSFATTPVPEQRVPLLGSTRAVDQTEAWQDEAEGAAATIDPLQDDEGAKGMARSKAEVRRGKAFAALGAASILFAWLLFMGTAWLRLRSKADRDSSVPS